MTVAVRVSFSATVIKTRKGKNLIPSNFS